MAVKLLSGGNPQIAKGEGDAPVRAYIAAMRGRKQAIGERADGLIEAAVPGVRKAVRWNSPFYGASGNEGWFLSVRCFERCVKVTFFRGNQLQPMPPVASRQPDVRYLHIGPDAPLDEQQFIDWIRQASELPGEKL